MLTKSKIMLLLGWIRVIIGRSTGNISGWSHQNFCPYDVILADIYHTMQTGQSQELYKLIRHSVHQKYNTTRSFVRFAAAHPTTGQLPPSNPTRKYAVCTVSRQRINCFTLLIARRLTDVSCFMGPSMSSGICMEIHTKSCRKGRRNHHVIGNS